MKFNSKVMNYRVNKKISQYNLKVEFIFVNIFITNHFYLFVPTFTAILRMLSQMPTYCRKNHQDDDVLDHPVSQWPQDEIEILNGNCSFRVDVILYYFIIMEIVRKAYENYFK